MTMGKEIHYHN